MRPNTRAASSRHLVELSERRLSQRGRAVPVRAPLAGTPWIDQRPGSTLERHGSLLDALRADRHAQRSGCTRVAALRRQRSVPVARGVHVPDVISHQDPGRYSKNASILGGRICRYHGGAAPHVQKKAVERLRAFEHPALDVFEEVLKKAKEPAYRALAVRVAESVLDRTPQAAGEARTRIAADARREHLLDQHLAADCRRIATAGSP